jgi:tRNA1(Val) A37 N6-methylase TrmN6
VWSLLGELGYKGGKMLDPCAGTGIFGATAPGNTAVESIELNETSGRINQLVNGGPAYHAIVSPFEAVASRTEDGTYDAVVTNVPFGSNADRGRNKNFDPKHRGESLEWYFMCRSLEKLKHGGLAAFIVPRAWSARRAASPKSCAWP